jgi:cytochrome c-type biogenesis protein CcmH/NrfG
VDYNSPYYHEENKGSIFYAESWALTHYEVKDARENTHRWTDYEEESSLRARNRAASCVPTQVENSLRTAIKLNPSFAPAYDQLAVFYGMRRENLDEAHTLVLNAVQLDPGNLHYRLSTANILLQMQRPTDAIS